MKHTWFAARSTTVQESEELSKRVVHIETMQQLASGFRALEASHVRFRGYFMRSEGYLDLF